nr:hypothetical protein [uncultured Flavobacterium sp.]
MKNLYITALTLLLLACAKEKQTDTAQEKSDTLKTNVKAKASIDEDGFDNSEYLKPRDTTFNGYTFKYGYTSYNEEFENPGYLKVYKGSKELYKTTFKGEGDPFIQSFGYHELSGTKFVFALNYGVDACDYAHTIKYYVINPDDKVRFVKDTYSMTGGDQYASRYYKEFFPEDSAGIANTIGIVEGMIFHEHDQPNQADTTHVIFNANAFKVEKYTDNLGKVKE